MFFFAVYDGTRQQSPADFLLGYPNSPFRQYPKSEYNQLSHNLPWYFQNNWRITPNLTLDLGLRYEYGTNNQNLFAPGDAGWAAGVQPIVIDARVRIPICRNGIWPSRNNSTPIPVQKWLTWATAGTSSKCGCLPTGRDRAPMMHRCDGNSKISVKVTQNTTWVLQLSGASSQIRTMV